MTNEEKFKDSLQRKIESKEFPFDEREWEKAAAIIDNRRGSGTKSFFFYLSGVILLSLGYLNFHGLSESDANKLTSSINFPIEKNAETTFKSELIPTKSKSKNQTSTLKKESKIIHESITQKKNLPAQATTTAAAIQSNTSTTKITELASAQESNLPLRSETTASNLPPKHTNETVIQNEKSLSTIAASSIEPISLPNQEDINESIVAVTPPKTVSDSNTEPQVVQPVSDSVETIAQEEAPIVKTSLTASNTFVNSMKDSSAAEPKIIINNVLNFEIGGSYLFGWNNESGKDANGLNAVVGINYLSNIFPNYWFSFGIQYTRVGHLSSSSKTSKVTQYKLGEESEVTTITPNSIHYVALPFKLHRVIDEKNSFGINYTINYLLNVESQVETYTENIQGKTNYSSYTTSGYTEGFKLFNSQVGVFYRRHLYKELWLNAEFIFGLNDIKEDGFFMLNNFERNTGFKLTLSYNLFKH